MSLSAVVSNTSSSMRAGEPLDGPQQPLELAGETRLLEVTTADADADLDLDAIGEPV